MSMCVSVCAHACAYVCVSGKGAIGGPRRGRECRADGGGKSAGRSTSCVCPEKKTLAGQMYAWTHAARRQDTHENESHGEPTRDQRGTLKVCVYSTQTNI